MAADREPASVRAKIAGMFLETEHGSAHLVDQHFEALAWHQEAYVYGNMVSAKG